MDYNGFAGRVGGIVDNVERAVSGKRDDVFLAVVALLAGGHVLIEYVPGVVKTLLAKSLLEAMEEGSVTVDGQTRHLPRPFCVVATQNPIEHEGTYPLPHAELDRFMIKMDLGYPDEEAEMDLLKLSRDPAAELEPVVGPEEFEEMRLLVEKIHASEAVLRYVVSVTSATREHGDVYLGASPRASRMLLAASRARAAANGRSYCTPDDVKAMAMSVLTHRIIPTGGSGDAGTAAGEIVREILGSVPVTEAV